MRGYAGGMDRRMLMMVLLYAALRQLRLRVEEAERL